jgi:hypothetical protein
MSPNSINESKKSKWLIEKMKPETNENYEIMSHKLSTSIGLEEIGAIHEFD